MKYLIEIAIVVLIGYLIWHEEDLVDFEDELLYKIKKWLNQAHRLFYGGLLK